MGEKLGARTEAAALLATMDTKLAAVRARAVHPAMRTLLYEPNGYSSVEGVTEELMRLAGLENAAPGYRPTREGTIPIVAVIAAAPQLLIFSGRNGPVDSRAELAQHHPALATLSDRTYSAWANLVPLACPGPWSVDAAETFAALGRKARALAKPDSGN